MNERIDKTAMLSHFFDMGQLRGFSGSFRPSQSTIFDSHVSVCSAFPEDSAELAIVDLFKGVKTLLILLE